MLVVTYAPHDISWWNALIAVKLKNSLLNFAALLFVGNKKKITKYDPKVIKYLKKTERKEKKKKGALFFGKQTQIDSFFWYSFSSCFWFALCPPSV